jgi:alpha-L-fucosidase
MNKLDWFNEARFGMFIHWGAYSVAGRGEWVLNRERIPYDEYIESYVNHFTAENFEPEKWVEMAKKAGMKYMILTTRHHDGFALWDTKTSDFNSVKMGPKKDLVRMFADAVREGGLKLGFYYSFADWHHPDYPGASYRDWPEEWKDEESRLKFVKYYHAQLKELMTEYGKVDILWYDGCTPSPTDGKEINEYIHSIQPDILINERNGMPYDFEVCEQAIRAAETGVAWEACITLNDNWGYFEGDRNYKDAKKVISMLGEVASGGGNLLLNVGPRQDGTIPEESVNILTEVGAWLAKNGEFLYGSSRSPFSWNNFGRLTTKGSKVYVHIYNFPGEEICISEIKNKIVSAFILDTGEPIEYEQTGERLFLKKLPLSLKDQLVPVIVLEIDGEPEAITKRTSF